MGFQYINGEYRPHAAEETFKFDTNNADVMKIIFATKKQFENVYSASEWNDDQNITNILSIFPSSIISDKSRLKQLLKRIQIMRHKVYLIVCHAEIR